MSIPYKLLDRIRRAARVNEIERESQYFTSDFRDDDTGETWVNKEGLKARLLRRLVHGIQRCVVVFEVGPRLNIQYSDLEQAQADGWVKL